MKLVSAGMSVVGGRENNEDAFGSLVYFAGGRAYKALFVADGLGGEAHGERGSKAAVKAAKELLPRIEQPTKANLRQLFQDVDRRVLRSGGKTTLSLLTVRLDDGVCYAAWCGDSPLVVAAGTRCRLRATQHGVDGMLFRCLGSERGDVENPWEPDVGRGRLHPGDVVIVASDGLDEILDEEALPETLADLQKSGLQSRDPASLTRVCERMIKRAIERGSTDNCTILLGVLR